MFTFFPDKIDKPTIVDYNVSDLSVNGCTVRSVPGLSHFKVTVILKGSDGKARRATAMIDSGADGVFMDRRWAERQGIELGKLGSVIGVKNIDGTFNRDGAISQYAELELQAGTHSENLRFLITDLGSDRIILGLPWLRKHNPGIDWGSGKVHLGKDEGVESDAESQEEEPPFRRINASRRVRRGWYRKGLIEHSTDEIWIAAGYTYS